MTENNNIAKTFNSFFETITDSLNLFSWSSKINVCDDKVQGIIHNFSKTILVFLKSRKKFNLTNDFLSTVRKVVKDLPSDKLSASEIPIKTLKESTTFP